MSLLKKSWFWGVIGVLSMVSAYLIRNISIAGYMALYILAPLAIGIAIRMYLDRVQYTDVWEDEDWKAHHDALKSEPLIPLVLWN